MSRLERPARRIADGSAAVARRLGNWACAWCARGRRDDLTGFVAILGIILRGLLLLLGVYIIARIVRAIPALMWLLTSAWLIAAWQASKAVSETVPEAAEEVPQAPSGEGWRAFVLRAIGDRQGVHLRDLLDTLHRCGHHPDWEVADVRRVCEAAGIPIRARVRVRGVGVTVGVHRDDLQPLLHPSPGSGHQSAPDSEPHAA